MATNPHLYPSMTYDPIKDLLPIHIAVKAPILSMVILAVLIVAVIGRIAGQFVPVQRHARLEPKGVAGREPAGNEPERLARYRSTSPKNTLMCSHERRSAASL